MHDTKNENTTAEQPHVHEKTIVRDLHEDRGKNDVEHLELVETTVEIPDYSEKETKRILFKLDCRLLPMLAFFYLLAYLDRGNGEMTEYRSEM